MPESVVVTEHIGEWKGSYDSKTPEKVIETGYWVELCNEFDDPVYFAHLYNSHEVYIALISDSIFRN